MNSTTLHNTTTTTVNLANQRKRKGSLLSTDDDLGNTKQLSSASNFINGGTHVDSSGCHCASAASSSKAGDYLDSLPIGYRFMPTDEEIISHYLRKKINNQSLPKTRIIETNIYEYHPKDLAAAYPEAIKGSWYFFTTRDKKYSRGNRPSRNAGPGYWKATGFDRPIKENETKIIGGKKALAYYVGRQPDGTKTDWMMHEYVVVDGSLSDDQKFDDYVLCKIYKNEKKKEKGVGSKDHDENLPTNIKDRSEQADQNNVVIQYPYNHQSMNNNIGQVMVPYQQSHMASNNVVVENNLPILGSSHLPLSVQMMTSFQLPLVGLSCSTPLYLPPQHGHVHPETYSCDPSSSAPAPKEAQAVLQGGDECDGRVSLKRNIELMLAKDGYDWLNDIDDDWGFEIDKLKEQLEVDDSKKDEDQEVEEWMKYLLDI